MQFHHYRCDPAVLRVLIEESRQTIDEIQDMGIEFRGIRTMYDKHESLMTWHLFVGGAAKVIERFVKSIRQGGGELRTQTSAQRLIMNNGKVTGVEARDAKGNTIILHAKKVIIATGGFAANKEMLAQNVTDSSALGMVEPIWLRGPVVDGRTGDGITMARLVGANVAGMHRIFRTFRRSTSSRAPTNSSKAAVHWLSRGSGSIMKASASSMSRAAPCLSTSTMP